MQRLLLLMSAVVWLVVPYNVANKSFRKHHRPVWELHHKGHEHCTQLREMSCIDEDTLDDMLQPGYVVGALKCNNFTTIAHPGVFILFRFNLIRLLIIVAIENLVNSLQDCYGPKRIEFGTIIIIASGIYVWEIFFLPTFWRCHCLTTQFHVQWLQVSGWVLQQAHASRSVGLLSSSI